jgi:hypothetical protein
VETADSGEQVNESESCHGRGLLGRLTAGTLKST